METKMQIAEEALQDLILGEAVLVSVQRSQFFYPCLLMPVQWSQLLLLQLLPFYTCPFVRGVVQLREQCPLSSDNSRARLAMVLSVHLHKTNHNACHYQASFSPSVFCLIIPLLTFFFIPSPFKVIPLLWPCLSQCKNRANGALACLSKTVQITKG